MLYLKFGIRMIIRFVLRVISIFIHIKNYQICFESFDGKQISCNPYYIYRAMISAFPDYEYVWIYNYRHSDNRIKCVKRRSLKYFYTLMSSRVYISNSDIPLYIAFRSRQLVINTWHGGGAYKKVGTAFANNNLTRWYFHFYNKSLSYFVSSSRKFSEIMEDSFRIDKKKFLPVGMPRNDLLFDCMSVGEANIKIREYYSIKKEEFVILYAPTFRSYDKVQSLKFEIEFIPIINVVRNVYQKDCRILIRGHHRLSSVKYTNNDKIVDVSKYPYMQELLCAADMLVSDYSSCIWDYSFLYRPCILFVPDLHEYQACQDFYMPIGTWGFPVAETQIDLIKAIESFDRDEYAQKMKTHHNDLGSYEQGIATKSISGRIVAWLNT